jgi:hypothetical protein
VVVAAAFLAAAGAKLAGVPMLVDVFNQIGLGQDFRYVTACRRFKFFSQVPFVNRPTVVLAARLHPFS